MGASAHRILFAGSLCPMDKEINSKEENSVYEVFLSIHSWVACRCRFHSEFMNIKRALIRKLDPKEISGRYEKQFVKDIRKVLLPDF